MMPQRGCTICMAWRQKSPPTRPKRIRGETWQQQRTRTHQSLRYYHHPRIASPPTAIIPASNPFNRWDLPRRHLSVAPHAVSSTPNDVAGTAARPVSESQRRSAQLELDHMNRSTSRLLATNLLDAAGGGGGDGDGATSDASLRAIVNEARVALHYWSRRWYMHFHPGFGRAAKGSALSLDALRRRWGTEDGAAGAVIAAHDDVLGSVGGAASDGLPSTQHGLGGDHGAQMAERLLDWSLSNDLVRRGLFDGHSYYISRMEGEDKEGGRLGVSPNLTCVNIIETYLLPTAYGGVGGGGSEGAAITQAGDGDGNDQALSEIQYQQASATLTKNFTISSSYVRAVVDATRAMNKMKQLQSDFPDELSPDTLSIKAELSVWSKRATVLQDQALHGGGGVEANGAADALKRLEQEGGRDAAGGEIYGEDAYTLRGCLSRMESIVSQAEERFISTKDERIRPSVDWYNHLLGAWARSDLEEALHKTKQILHGMEAYDDAHLVINQAHGGTAAGNLRQCWARPDTISYNSVLYCLARDAGNNRAKEAEALLQQMKDRYRRTSNNDMRPDELTYGAVLHALAQAGMAPEAEAVLDALEDSGQDEGVVPSLTIYNTVLNAWANSRRRDAPARADSLLERMRILSSSGVNPPVAPDTVSVSSAISCHARSGTRIGAERGERMLAEALAMYSRGDARVKPDSIMFGCAITGWTSISGIEDEEGLSSEEIPAERAEMLLQKMKVALPDVRPVAQTFNIVLDCWAKSEMNGAADRALKLMREMPDYGIAPDECSYNSVLHAMTKESDPKWVDRAENMFRVMKDKVSISEITYHVMMNIYGKSTDSDGARKAEGLLRAMEEENLNPDNISYNICIDACARRGDHRKAESLLEEMISLSDQGKSKCRPTIHSFASVVNALAKSGDVDAAARAKEVVRKVEELEYVSPNSILYNSLIDCIVKSGQNSDNALEAEEILLRMEKMHRSGNSKVRPNSYTYSMVLTSCARSKQPGAPERAERILINMESLYAEGLSDVVANSRCYSAAISAWARSSSPIAVERALALIDRMEQNGRNSSPHGKPSAYCYNACIHAIAKSQRLGKAKLCREILQRMVAARNDGYRESDPSLITYSTIINACAYTHGNEPDKKEAFDLAKTCFQALLESNEIEPCVSSFTNFFLVISRHLKHGAIRDQFSEAIFLEGCKRGKIGKQVLNNFRKASPLVANRILSQYEEIPLQWGKHIRYDGHQQV